MLGAPQVKKGEVEEGKVGDGDRVGKALALTLLCPSAKIHSTDTSRLRLMKKLIEYICLVKNQMSLLLCECAHLAWLCLRGGFRGQ